MMTQNTLLVLTQKSQKIRLALQRLAIPLPFS